jgi:hypothetical protein
MTYTENGITSPLLDILAKVQLTIGEHTKAVKEQQRWQQVARRTNQPVLSKMPWSGICNASGFGIFVNTGAMAEGPDQGYIWYVRRISVLGTIPGTSVTGRGDIFISAADYPTSFSTLSQFGVGDWQDGTNSIPNNAFYGRGEMPMRFNESLTIVISGAPANQQVGGQIVFEQFEEAAIRQDWAM